MQRLLLVLLGASLLAFSAFVAVKVPFLAYGMPSKLPGAEAIAQWRGWVFGAHIVSGQIAVVCLIGATLGARAGFLAVALYLALGFGGLPVFAHGGGPAYLGQPTVGYLLGFLPAAIWVGLWSNSPRLDPTCFGMVGGLLVVKAVGGFVELIMTGHLFHLGAWWQIIALQVLAFLPGELALLTCLAVALTLWRRTRILVDGWRLARRARRRPLFTQGPDDEEEGWEDEGPVALPT